MSEADLRLHTSPAKYVDSDHASVRQQAERLTARLSAPQERVKVLYGAVRDGIRYDPYVDYTSRETFRASSVLAAGRGYCVGKAALYAALCRAVDIPARIGLADVSNQLSTPRLLAAVGTDVFAYHSYVEVYLGGRWLKATPTFNDTLCAKLNVAPLAFEGTDDALLQPFGGEGREFMQYLIDHGAFFDVPAKFLIREMASLYLALCQKGGLRGRMEERSTRSRPGDSLG